MPLVSSMDHVGPITRSVRDTALVLQTIAGPDDSNSLTYSETAEDLLENLDTPIDGMVVAIPRDYFFEGGDKEVIEIVEKSLDVFCDLGVRVQEVSFPDCHIAYEAANAIFSEIVDANGKALKMNPSGFSDEFISRYESVARYRGKAYDSAQKYRQDFKDQVEAVMNDCDVLAMPTSTVVAAPITKQPPSHVKERRKNACIFNFTGQPSISIPCGFTGAGLPVGLMLSGGLMKDSTVLRIAQAFENSSSWRTYLPPAFSQQ